MACPHIKNTSFKVPSAYTQVHKEECTQCFESQDGLGGIDVCLTCFNGGCAETEQCHAKTHYNTSHHPLAVNIRRRIVSEKPKRTEDESPPPQKISKLAIVPDSETIKYEFFTKVRCRACPGVEVSKDTTPELNAIVEAILATLSSAKQSEVKAWEEEIYPCEHTLCLTQDSPKKLETQDLAHCTECDLKENLWLCLTCGTLHCGRKHYDGSGGNNHGIEHFEKTWHVVSCKLGTITPEGTADIYCYKCNDAKLDNELAVHLANWGINISQQLKTEKNMTELQLEQNMKFDFSMTTEDGKQLEPKFGPGYTGLKNLGNSCYMASIIQAVFDINTFQDRYFIQLQDHASVCQNDPANCWDCQLHKLADGLLSGNYSLPIPSTTDNDTLSQEGIAPGMFKTLFGKGHEEFASMRQQDAYEFFQLFCKTVSQKEHTNKDQDPTQTFEFSLEQRLQCGKCRKIRYQVDPSSSLSINVPAKRIGEEDSKTLYEPVGFYECLDNFVQEDTVEGYNCPHCKEKTTAFKSVKFNTFPDVLVIHARRFAFVDWVPRKLDVKITFPKEPINLDKYLGTGQQPGEDVLPEDEVLAEAPSFDQSAVEQLMGMGFPEIRCQKALINTGNNGAEVAMNWLFEHMDDPDIDAPLATAPPSSGPTDDQITTLCDMGFTPAQAKKALRETNNSTERALDWLFNHPGDLGEAGSSDPSSGPSIPGDATPPFDYRVKSFVSHKGTSVHCGHYVAHVRKEGEWVLFNDNKVAIAPNPPIGEAYVYFLQRFHSGKSYTE
ncbi:hypothetical protein J3Q64DRAFT_1775672 [Phycomyces blakesleeanus]|uniref:Ubiquitin carboxyl-terminal hydrolase n=2 Tax=Phycomyces blakesleeanus TaxID=4837 RepID=A0A162X2C4_PHYB8|nr:hypothetical protein PHYBLDRAFT_75255 [Phycomyces blakesleeanus NRRL 1555(-)]OAD72145.1 hypothetical protein PHYBLDRAFT_75255 [Phycomyces blakesleeanus NRRL 1555(-)]|eukprot:XP_018290185.1 hypothetical protein PHYBLDRAFT_75255 [Phycomyces blakesleeanus NRRL 1555(-)]